MDTVPAVSTNKVHSKWEMIDYGNDDLSEEDGSEVMSSKDKKSDVNYKLDSLNRQQLRDVEVLIKF